jgi:hypothetical protein
VSHQPLSHQLLKTPSVVARLARVANQHDGLLPVSHLGVVGVDRSVITRRVQANSLVLVTQSTYGAFTTTLTPLQRAQINVGNTPGSWVSHTAAAAHHGIPVPEVHADISMKIPAKVRVSGVRTHRMKVMPDSQDLAFVNNVLISRPERCLTELAEVLVERRLELALDHCLHRKLTTTARVRSAMARRGTFRGCGRLRRLLDDREDGQGMVRSWLEQDLRKVVRNAGLPAIVCNFHVEELDRWIDGAWPALRLGLEAESWEHHDSPTDWGRTMIRGRGLTASGWTILPVVVADVRNPKPLIADIRATMARLKPSN